MAKFIVNIFHAPGGCRLELEAPDNKAAACMAMDMLKTGQCVFQERAIPIHVEVMGPVIDAEMEVPASERPN